MVPDSSTTLRTLARQLPGASGPGLDELRKKAHARLAERVDPARARFKPLSLLRQEARRALETFFDQDFSRIPKADRDRTIEDVVCEAYGPLEELFRDETVKEFLVLTAKSVIVRKNDVWTPASIFFRDDAQMRRTVVRLAEQGERTSIGPAAEAAWEVRLANGFRMTAVLPPEVMDTPPMAVFVRLTASAAPAPAPAEGLSKINATPAPRTPRPGSGVVGTPAPALGLSGTHKPDPLSRYRQRVTSTLVSKLAAAGVFDVAAIPGGELHRIVAAVVADTNVIDRLGLSESDCDRLTLEILSGMSR